MKSMRKGEKEGRMNCDEQCKEDKNLSVKGEKKKEMEEDNI